MTLTEAKLIASKSDLSAFSETEIEDALARLQTPEIVARMRNVKNERTLERWHDRVERLQIELETIRNQDEARKVG